MIVSKLNMAIESTKNMNVLHEKIKDLKEENERLEEKSELLGAIIERLSDALKYSEELRKKLKQQADEMYSALHHSKKLVTELIGLCEGTEADISYEQEVLKHMDEAISNYKES